jgi:hypothetical protein
MSDKTMYELINGELVEVSEVKKAQIIAEQTKSLAKVYISQRAVEYPPIEDYIDGVVKGDQAQIDKYIADCLAIKAKYPKETE